MQILGWIIWGITIVIAALQVPLIREEAKGVKILAASFLTMLLIGIIVTSLSSVSKLNLLWWIPASYAGNIYFFRLFIWKSIHFRIKRK